MKISLVGIDLAKNVFEILAVDEYGKRVFSKRLRRSEVSPFFANLPKCRVAMEACGGCFYWARLFESQGHEAMILPAQFVTPYRKSSKNDRNDAEAICEAAQRPNMRRVPVKPLEQQDRELEHNYRRRLVGARNRIASEMRSTLHEYGIVLPVSLRLFEKNVRAEIESADNGLTSLSRQLLTNYLEDFSELTKKLNLITKRIELEFKTSEIGQRIHEIPGIGPISGSAFAALQQQARNFKNGRNFAAWLGLVPNQYSSGEKRVLGRIHKRGNTYLRTLLIHGARAVLSKAKLKTDIGDPRIKWALELEKKKGMNKTVVAYANKNARVIWHILTKDKERYLNAS